MQLELCSSMYVASSMLRSDWLAFKYSIPQPSGMPYPANLDTAISVESVVRGSGCVPATIAVVRGVPHVGLTRQQLEQIAELGSTSRKCSKRDLAAAVA